MVKPTIFISYLARDERLADSLKKWIAADFLDFPTVFIASEIPPGTVWPVTIIDALRAASIVCVLRSERTQTRWISMEIGAAMVTGATLIPICYGDLKKEDLEDVLVSHQAVSIRSITDINNLYQTIALTIGCKRPAVSRELIEEIDQFHSIRIREAARDICG